MEPRRDDKRKKEKEDWDAHAFAILYSKLRTTKFKRDKWHRYEDDHSDKENMPATLSAVDRKFPPGLYYYGEKGGNSKIKFNIYLDKNGCAKAVPDDRAAMGLAGLDEERRSAEMDFLLATQGTRTIKISLPAPNDPLMKEQYKKELNLYFKLAAEKGAALTFDEQTEEFLKTLKPEEVKRINDARKILDINKEKCRMLLGQSYMKDYDNYTSQLDNKTKLERNAQTTDDELQAKMFEDANGVELDNNDDTKHDDIFNKAEELARETDERINAINKMIERVDYGLEAQDNILDNPMKVSRAGRLAKMVRGTSLKSATWGTTEISENELEKALNKKNLYNDAEKTIKGVEEDFEKHKSKLDPLLRAMTKELDDLQKRQAIVELKLNRLKTNLAARNNNNPDDATKAKIEKAKKQLEAIEKSKQKLNEQVAKFNKANKSFNDMPQHIKKAEQSLEQKSTLIKT